MSLPVNLTYVTVVGSLADGVDRRVIFRTPTWLIGLPFVPPFGIAATVAVDGSFTVNLPATDDAAWAPINWTYDVQIIIDGQELTGSLAVPEATIGDLDLFAVLNTDVPADASEVTYLLAAARGVAGGVAALDGSGQVLDGSGNPVGGGGGGGTPSGTVVSGTAYAQSSTAGAATAYSRGDHSHGTVPFPTYAQVTGKPSTFTPAAHAATHASVGSDPVAVAASQISDSTAVGRAVLVAVDAAAGRTAIGAGTSSLALGTTGTTAAAGNDSRLSDARTPTTHAASHASAGSDPVAVAESQVTGLVADLAAKQPVATLTTKGDLYVATGAGAVTRLPVGSNTNVLTADSAQASGVKWAAAGGGGGTVPTFARAVVTSGDVTMVSDATWTIISGLSITLAAVAGDNIRADIGVLLNANGSSTDFYDLVVVVSGAIVRFGSTGTSSPTAANEGDPALYPNPSGTPFKGASAFMTFAAVSGDLSGGNVTFGIAHKGPGGGKIFAGTNYPLRWTIRNDHQ